jgi:hypothetical protein
MLVVLFMAMQMVQFKHLTGQLYLQVSMPIRFSKMARAAMTSHVSPLRWTLRAGATQMPAVVEYNRLA